MNVLYMDILSSEINSYPAKEWDKNNSNAPFYAIELVE